LPGGTRSTDPFDEERMDGGLMEAKAGLRASLIARLDELSAGIRSEQDLDRLKRCWTVQKDCCVCSDRCE